MQNQLARTDSPHRNLPTAYTPRVAVVLNGNARSVNERIIRDVQALLGADEALFVSQSLDQAQFIARQIVNRRFDVVLCGGGDGTLTRVVSDVLALRPHRVPAFGVLRLGTGNAVAAALGVARASQSGIARELTQARDSDARTTLPLLNIEGKLAPFAGVGLDSLILEDYNRLKDNLDRVPFGNLLKGHAGYGLSIATRSMWRYLRETRPEVVIRNVGAPALPVDLAGCPTGPAIGTGQIIYRGPVTVAAASTVPFYGFGMRMFPQACLDPERFQLRIADLSLGQMLAKLPQVLSGELEHERLWDFSCTAIAVELDKPAPLQIGGDLAGTRQSFRIGIRDVPCVTGSNGVVAAPAPREVPMASGRLAA
ncbi:MAG: diacylglycerol kinase [Myxococcales bacterium]|nr:diacylglycerol kinase [Myxococcales bacterium]